MNTECIQNAGKPISGPKPQYGKCTIYTGRDFEGQRHSAGTDTSTKRLMKTETNSLASSGCLDAPCSSSTKPLHVYDWLDIPPITEAEKDAKEWLNLFCQPTMKKPESWLARYRVTVEWKGKRYTCSGASRIGDVWLKTERSQNFYDHRVNVVELSHWKRIRLPNA
jgi:hypothetical protein